MAGTDAALLKRQEGWRHGGSSDAGQGKSRVSLAVTGAACLTVLVPLGSLAGRTECRSRYSRRAPHEPLFRIHGSTPLRSSAPIPSPRPVRQSDTRPRWAHDAELRPQRASAPLSARRAASGGASSRRCWFDWLRVHAACCTSLTGPIANTRSRPITISSARLLLIRH